MTVTFTEGSSRGLYADRPSRDVLPILLAGGQGSRLHELTEDLCKPAVPFLGSTRIVDFTLENLRRSGMSSLMLATQYRADCLHSHIHHRWSDRLSVAIRHAPTITGRREGSRGTADAVRLLIPEIDAIAPRDVLILAADHVYRMDYRPMLAEHREKGASVTVAADCVPRASATAFGVLEADPAGRITRFVEKPAHPKGWSRNPEVALASMGLYIYKWETLRALLLENPEAMDFGHDILPLSVDDGRAFTHAPAELGPFYWRDVGTLDALRRAALDFLTETPPFELPDPTDRTPRLGWMDSVVMDGAFISEGALLANCIVAPGVFVPFGMKIGVDAPLDARLFRRTEDGTVLVTPEMLAAVKPVGDIYVAPHR